MFFLLQDVVERFLRLIIICGAGFAFANAFNISSWLSIGIILVLLELFVSALAIFLNEQASASLHPYIKIFWGQSSAITKYTKTLMCAVVLCIIAVGLVYAYLGTAYVLSHLVWQK